MAFMPIRPSCLRIAEVRPSRFTLYKNSSCSWYFAVETDSHTKDGHREGERPASIHKWIENQVRKTPDAVAVDFGSDRLTYEELDKRSNQLACHLQQMGVGPEVLVAISMERKPELLVGLLGILKAGGAYLPLDPEYPNQRLAYMLEHSRAAVLLTEAPLVSRLPEFAGERVCLDLDWAKIETTATAPPDDQSAPSHLAYVIYTSGSTGQPKGVEIPHSAVLNLLSSIRNVPGMTADDRVLAITTLSFDISVTELFLPLAVGACVCMVDRRVASDGLLLARKIEDSRATYMQATPATWRMLLDSGWTGRKGLRIVSGGETLNRDLAAKLLPCCEELWNLYGPTEATVWATTHCVIAVADSIPIGIPIANTELRLLDENQNPVPAGQSGELYIGGAGLARGYRFDPLQTSEKFIEDPFSEKAGARLYRTGDLARYQEVGALLHLGRMDHQVKVRGYRIELGEIEAVLESLPSVTQAIVLTRTLGEDDTRLVAYVKPAGPPQFDRSGLREALRVSLPEYMIPTTFVVLENFPLTPSGKVDRKALPAPDSQSAHSECGYVPPANSLEEELAAMVSEILKSGKIGRTSDLFDFGADSLKLAQLVARVRDRLGTELEQRCLFEHSTVAGIATLIEETGKSGGASGVPSIQRVERNGHLPLSFAQQRVWFIHQLHPDSLAYNFQCTLRMHGKLDKAALEKSLNAITRRHEIYRTTYALEGDQPTQVIHEHEDWRLPVVDFSSLPEAEGARAVHTWYARAFRERYDPVHLPMARWRLLKFGEEDHVLVHMEHHLVHDGWSFNLFLQELFALYSAEAEGRPNPLTELPVQFADFAAWERKRVQSPDVARQLDYWKEKLKGLPPLLELSGSKPRLANQNFEGAAPRVEVAMSTCRDLRKFGRSHRSTLFMTMLTGYLVLLQRSSGRSDIPVGTVFANRLHSASERLIGMILNNVVIRATLGANPTFSELLVQVRNLVLEASSNQEAPFDLVVEAIDPPRSSAYNPLFQVFFGFHDEPMPEHGPKDLEVTVTPVISNGSAKFDLGVIVIPHSAQQVGLRQGSEEDGLTLVWEHNTKLFESSTMDRMIADYQHILDEMIAHPDRPVLSDVLDLDTQLNPDPGARTMPQAESVNQSTTPPRNELEARLMDIWKEALAVETFGVNDDFFDLGGHSLLATRIINRMRRDLGCQISFQSFFRNRTIASMAELLHND